MNNYEFCVNWVIAQKPGDSATVLDYGCGSGKIVEQLREQKVEAFGCDVFFEGGDYSKFVDGKLIDNKIIRRMNGLSIPFESNSFDFVTNNQVMEHVENLDAVLAEIHRVLKPGGKILSIFPDGGVWREGHCGIPFLHWFPKKIHSRIYWAALFRVFGFGYHKGNKSVMNWSRDFCDWLDKWTYYRTRKDIDLSYNKYFSKIKHIEGHWLEVRYSDRTRLVSLLPRVVQNNVVKKLGGLVFEAHKRA